MITAQDLNRVFTSQRELTTHAIEGPAGLESYFSNLGFDYQGMEDWTRAYARGNFGESRSDWTDGDVTFVASLLCRALAVGLILGRENKL